MESSVATAPDPAQAPAPGGWPLRREAFRGALLPVASVLVPLSILAIVGWLSWRDVWADARAEMIRTAASAAEYGQRAMEGYALAAGRVNDRLRGLSDEAIMADGEALQRELQRMKSELSQSEMSYVIDREGRPLLASHMLPAPRGDTLADRDYFEILRAPGAPEVHVSRTLLGRFDGKLLFSVVRRRSDTGNPPRPDGFDGVVLVSVSPHILADGLRRLLPGPSDRLALVGADGFGRSTTSGLIDLGKPLPQVPPESPFRRLAEEGVESAVYLSTTAMPGARALLAMRRLEGFPIYATAIRPEAAIIGRWLGIMAPQLAFGLPATLALLLLSLRVWRQQRRLAAINASLRRDNELNSDRLERAKQFGLVGTFEADPRSGRSLRSPEYMWVQGLPAVATRETHADWLARLHVDDRARAARILREALADPDVTEYAQSYRIVTPTGEVRWIAARAGITRDASGEAVMLLGAHVDVTPLRAAEAALAETDARLRLAQDAVGIGNWELSGGARTVRLSAKMASLCGLEGAEAAPGPLAVMRRVHRDDRRALLRWIRTTLRSASASGEFRVLRPAEADGEGFAWLAMRATLLASPKSDTLTLTGIAYDVTETKRTQEMTLLMAREVEHRAKNALAVVLGLLRMTRSDSVERLTEVLEGRIRALSQTMGLLGRGRWQGADLRDLLMSELEPFQREDGSSTVVSLTGPPVLIGVDAAQPLSMAVHELTTNAAKYGALSTPQGRLTIAWQVDGGRVALVWRETGGPALQGAPSEAGFGSRLIATLFEGQLEGAFERRWKPEGLVCRIEFPIGAAAPRSAG